MNINQFTKGFLCLVLIFSSVLFYSCEKLQTEDFNQVTPEKSIEKWANEYFSQSSNIKPQALADFAQITFGTIYEYQRNGSDIKIDTVDLILETPFNSTIKDAVQFTTSLLDHLDEKINEIIDELHGVVILPRSINGLMYTRVLLLSESLPVISNRNDNCFYSDDYNWKNAENKCTKTKSYEALMNGFNKQKCNWRFNYPVGCTVNSTFVYRVAPSTADQEFSIPCNSLQECLDMSTTSFSPQICNAGSTPSYCSILKTGNTAEPKYKLFLREKTVNNLCISPSLMNQYQILIEEFAYDILDTELYQGLDLDWRYKSVFLTYQGSDFSLKAHRGVILYEKCTPKHIIN